jgi:mono/diheme cytochrome c family protein
MNVRNVQRVLGALALATFAGGAAQAAEPAKKSARVARGEYLVRIASCNDCHTPMKMGKDGPEPDMTRMLSGHPQAMVLPPPPKLGDGPWGFAGAMTMTAWAGPWGISYTANLTPDPDTGLGSWTEQNFIDTIRNGKVLGKGRPLLPPMPWQWARMMTDEDLKAIYAYLRTIPAVKNKVPDPVAPEEQRAVRN